MLSKILHLLSETNVLLVFLVACDLWNSSGKKISTS